MEFTLTALTDQDINVIGVALQEVPFKLAAPLIAKLQAQVNEQQKVAAVVAEAAKALPAIQESQA